jgi:hypothetical protein
MLRSLIVPLTLPCLLLGGAASARTPTADGATVTARATLPSPTTKYHYIANVGSHTRADYLLENSGFGHHSFLEL